MPCNNDTCSLMYWAVLYCYPLRHSSSKAVVLPLLRTTSVRKYAREDCLLRCSPGKAAALLFQLTITGHKDTSKRVERFFGGQQYLAGIAAALAVCSSTLTTVGDALHVLEIRLPLRSHFTREKDANVLQHHFLANQCYC